MLGPCGILKCLCQGSCGPTISVARGSYFPRLSRFVDFIPPANRKDIHMNTIFRRLLVEQTGIWSHHYSMCTCLRACWYPFLQMSHDLRSKTRITEKTGIFEEVGQHTVWIEIENKCAVRDSVPFSNEFKILCA